MAQKQTAHLTHREALLSLGVSIVITLVFFYKVPLGFVPFPGDLLLAESKPWSTYSYEGYLPGTVPTKAQYPDVIRQLYPWRMLAVDQMKEGRTPLWNSYNFSGSPLLANFQSAPYYPLNILFWLLPTIDAWTVLVLLQPLLALWFTYLYVRKLNLHPLASWFAGVSYAFSAFSTVLLEYNTMGHVILLLPLTMLAIEFLREKISAAWLGILLLSLSIAALAGHPQIFAYLLIGTWTYTFIRIKPLKISLLINAFSLLSLGIAAIQYVPGIELIQHAARSSHDAKEVVTKLLIQPWQLLMLPFPNIFGNPATRSYWPSDTFASKVTSIGLLPLFFLPALWRTRKSFFAKFFLITTVVILIFVTRNPLSSLLAQLNIPLWSTSNPTLMVFLLSFALAIGTGIGVDSWTRENHTKVRLFKRITSVILFFILLIGSIVVVQQMTPDPWSQRLHVALRAIIYASGLSLALCLAFTLAVVKPKLMKLALFFLLIVHVADLWWMFQRFNPFAPKTFVYPSAPVVDFLKSQEGFNRFWGYGTASIGPNIATQLRLYSPDGYDPLYPKWYGEFISGSVDGTIQTQFTGATRSDAMVVPGFGEKDLSSNLNRLRVLDILGVRYILDRTENASTLVTFPSNRFQLIYERDGWKIFENLASKPRVFLARNIETYGSPEEFSRRFFANDFDLNTILLEPNTGVNLPQSEGGTAAITSYSPNEVTIGAAATTDSLLFLSDTYYPGWKVYVDGQATLIYKVNYAFRGVVIPKGNHEVIFRYEPSSFSMGIKISLVSLLIATATLMIIAKRRYEIS